MSQRWPSTEEIINAVVSWTGLPRDELVSGRQGAWSERHARRILWSALRVGRNMSYDEIAKACGGRHHSTILRGIRDNPVDGNVVHGIIADARKNGRS